jgi:hypothetical protein
MINRRSTNDLLRDFAVAAIARENATDKGDARTANKYYDKLEDLYGEIRSRGKEAQQSFLALLADSDLRVRYPAAARALDFAPEAAIATLEALAQRPGLLASHARQLLKTWRAGELAFDEFGRIRPAKKPAPEDSRS